jgi:hypothetical protein
MRDESGVTAVMLAILLVVVIGMIALTVDGGLLWVKHRQVRGANDAAALAAAMSCALGKTQAEADASADGVAVANVADAAQLDPNAYDPSCNPDAGRVRVRYYGWQELMFGPAVSVSSPKQVVGTAVGVWGAAGGADGVVPVMISAGALNNCDVPSGTGDKDCVFWWHKDVVSQATWSVLDLNTWPSEPGGECHSNFTPPTPPNQAVDGFPHALLLESNPTYVCTQTGAVTSVMNAMNDYIPPPHSFLFPVNDPAAQVDENGNVCAFGSDCQVEMYAIIGFVELEVYYFDKGPQAYNACKAKVPSIPNVRSKGDFFCMMATWKGYSTGGYLPGGGAPFGLVAIALEE